MMTRAAFRRQQRDQVERRDARQRAERATSIACGSARRCAQTRSLIFSWIRPGRTPGHDGDHDREGEHVLVGAGERQRDRADGLQAGEQEAAEDGAVDAAEPADDRGRKADHAEQEAHAEIDLVVVEAVHHAGEGGERRADREGDQHDGGEIDAHGARGLLVLRHRADGETELGPVEQELQPDDHRHAGRQHDHVVEPQVELAEIEGRSAAAPGTASDWRPADRTAARLRAARCPASSVISRVLSAGAERSGSTR